jgi:hypothetical protein
MKAPCAKCEKLREIVSYLDIVRPIFLPCSVLRVFTEGVEIEYTESPFARKNVVGVERGAKGTERRERKPV